MPRLLGEEFAGIARQRGPCRAVVDARGELSFDQLTAWSDRIAALVERAGARPGHRLAIVLPNSAAFVAAFFAAAKLGLVVAPVHWGSRSQELLYYLADIDPVAVVTLTVGADQLLSAMGQLAARPALVTVDGPDSCDVRLGGRAPGGADLAGADPGFLLLYTSGSTGAPKRVLRTQRQLTAEVAMLHAVFRVDREDRFLGATPFSHVNGLVRTMLTSMLAGATLYAVEQFARRPILELIERERLTFFGGVPYMFVVLAQTITPGGADLSSLRVVFSSSAPLLARDSRRFHRACGLFVRQLYGSTETGTISYNHHSDIEETLESVGAPLPGVKVTIVDERGQAVAPGEEGEVVVASPLAASSYDGNPVATQKSFGPAGYLTGDLARADAMENIWLTGRKSLMINRGGHKVNPYEVEDAIRQHPKVGDALVVGVPGPHGDQIVRCLIVASESCSAEEILLHCRARIADHKIPSRIEFVDTLPRTATGKYRRGS